MQRRHLLLAAAAAATHLAARAKPAAASVFAAHVATEPLLAPFKGVTDASGDRDSGPLLLRGQWPADLRGRFYRNGPALLERGAERYHHWFDGDGMVQQFTLGDGQVSHRGRLVRTGKLRTEQQAGRFVLPALGTQIDNSPAVSGPDAMNAANTSVLEHAGRVLALWEGGSAYGLDPKDLSTLGPITWRKDLEQVPFSAHPKVDASGHLWNFGTFGASIVVWHIDPQGRLVSAQVGESPYPGGMVHDMAITDRYLVVPLPPLSFDVRRPVVGDGPRRFAMQPGEPLRVLVMEKADIRKRRVFELPPQFVFHVGNAYETGDGRIVLSYAASKDAGFLDQGARDLMAGTMPRGGSTALTIATLNGANGKVDLQSLPGNVEFPRMDPRRIGMKARMLATAWAPEHSAHFGLFQGVQLMDMETGRARHHDYGPMTVAEEHIFIPKPGKTGELDAWLLGTSFDARRQATVLNLLDAAHLEDGPIAQAVLPYMLPLGLHGNFSPA